MASKKVVIIYLPWYTPTASKKPKPKRNKSGGDYQDEPIKQVGSAKLKQERGQDFEDDSRQEEKESISPSGMTNKKYNQTWTKISNK